MWEQLNLPDAESLYDAACYRAVTAAVQAKAPGVDAARLAKEDADTRTRSASTAFRLVRDTRVEEAVGLGHAADVRGGRQQSGGDLPLPRRPGVAGRADAEVAGDDETGGVWMNRFLGSPAEVAAAHGLALLHGMTVTDEPWGVREFHLRHPDGHTFRVGAG